MRIMHKKVTMKSKLLMRNNYCILVILYHEFNLTLMYNNSMKLILFLIIIAVIYFIATNIKVVHSTTFSSDEKKELDERNKVRTLLLSNHIRSTDGQNDNYQPKNIESFSQTNEYQVNDTYYNETIDSLPNATTLLDMIKDEFLDRQYSFNIPNLPVTTRNSNLGTKSKDKKYVLHIKNNIKEWNEVLTQKSSKKYINVDDVKPLFVKETESEFVITVNIRMYYLKRSLHLQATYYGKIDRNDDFMNDDTDTYILQLVQLKPISKNEFNQNFVAANNYTGPFMTMDEQMAYVNKINKMHENEEEYY
ncbi:hypothetical protein QJ857_gp0608 [Tupanvirus soda lake]|uniref:Uncharacterized protein n=2 Tax=Tupanvirus TaxID=2094720 RepID=A0A6N1NLS8_9VIRU|nr:hypothetical protein QJ857_gp0608 [Tupanvirus soda lake]QKU35435.1 hypothetical protein [Tupanvirus soda lake]